MREIRDVLQLPQLAEGAVASESLFKQAVAIVQESGKASASLLQRRLRIGYARSARLLDLMEDEGVI